MKRDQIERMDFTFESVDSDVLIRLLDELIIEQKGHNMEIHFYENEFAPADCLHGWIETRAAVMLGEKLINTTQMGLLSTSLFEFGYRVFINEDREIKLGEDKSTGREIKMGHDLFKLWINGEF